MKTLIYDAEIINCIPPKSGEINPNFSYCQSWNDYANMGIAVIGTWLSWENYFQRYRVFTNQQLEEFQRLVKQADRIVGFNSLSFDDKLLQANDVALSTDFDLLCEIRKASGQPPHYVKGVTRQGYSLENLAQANLGIGKSGTGELAPVLWQQGRYEEVINYCLHDIKLTKRLYCLFLSKRLYDPTNGRRLPYRGGDWTKIKTNNCFEKSIAILLGGENANPRQYPSQYFLDSKVLSDYQNFVNKFSGIFMY
jgi:hypothetical protein